MAGPYNKIPSSPGKGGDLYGAAKDLTGNDVAQKTAMELENIKRRKKVLGAAPAVSQTVMSLIGGGGTA